jgi:hypothetical protein
MCASVIFGFFLFVLPGCQGPAGPAGKDGLTLHDTIHIYDTTIKKDTIIQKDSMIVRTRDTMVINDSTIIKDTIVRRDTTVKYDTLLMNPACAVCHNNGQTLVEKQQEWAKTKHDTGSTWLSEGSNPSCQRCHNGAGYLAFVNKKPIGATDSLNTPNVSCRTCHMIHTKYDTTDWALTNVAPIVLLSDPTKTVDFGEGNLCGTCHQSRTNPTTAIDTFTAANIAITNRWGGHHSPVANILGSTGGWETGDAGASKLSGVMHKAKTTNGCVHCHVSDEGGKNHLFDPTLAGNVAACNNAACHTGSGAMAIKYTAAAGFIEGTDSVQVHFMNLMNQVRDTLVSLGALATANEDTTGKSAAVKTAIAGAKTSLGGVSFVSVSVPKAVAGLAFNYSMCLEDKSEGIHNLKYERYLLVSALAAVSPTAVPVYHN